MRHCRLLFCLASLLLSTAASPARSDYEGKPPRFASGGDVGAAIWTDAGRLHLSFTAPGKATPFTGKVCSRSALTDLLTHGLDDSDSAKLGPQARCVHLKLTVVRELEGFSVTLPTDAVIVDLRVGNEPLEPARIWIGRAGAHPDSSPFALPKINEERSQVDPS